MRILHTGDWHLGRTIGRQSRMPEFERVLGEVVAIARAESVDAMIIAGDTFDTFAPAPDAEKLLYETLGELLRDGVRVVIVAGNHDHATHLDALAGIFEMAGIYCVGSPPKSEGYKALRVPSRKGDEHINVVALPWIPERHAVEFDSLAGPREEALAQYAGRMEAAISNYCGAFVDDAPNVFVGHMLVEGAEVAQGGGERRLHIGDNFAVKAQALPSDASYVALGHVHKHQQIARPCPTFYSGSLLQLDFGEGAFPAKDGQDKFVNVAELKPGLPGQVRRVQVTGGRALRTVELRLADLASHADAYGDDYLRVVVEVDAPVLSLYEQVREVLPNALQVTAVRSGEAAEPQARTATRGLAPHELFSEYYRRRQDAAVPDALLAAFNELYEAETRHASA